MSDNQTTATIASESTAINPSFPIARVKKIVKIDKDITRISSEALYLVSGASEMFIQFLAEKSADIAAMKKRKTIKIDHLRVAVKQHQPTREFLLDSLPLPVVTDSQPLNRGCVERKRKEKVLPANTRRIDSFFKKPASKVGLNCAEHVSDVIEDGVGDVSDVIEDDVEAVSDVVEDDVEAVNDVVEDDVDDMDKERVEDVDDVLKDCVEDIVLKRVEDDGDVILVNDD